MGILAGAACLVGNSAGVTGEGSAFFGTFFTVEWFSWELEGSTASLLGTGVTLAGFLLSWRELDLVVSCRQGEELVFLVEEALWGALEKKPRMLFCCFAAVEDDELVFLAKDGVLGVDLSPISTASKPKE
jgi:hypothetical protein